MHIEVEKRIFTCPVESKEKQSCPVVHRVELLDCFCSPCSQLSRLDEFLNFALTPPHKKVITVQYHRYSEYVVCV